MIIEEGYISLSECKVNGSLIDYVYEVKNKTCILKDNTTGKNIQYILLEDALKL